jgi:hypothetical protein
LIAIAALKACVGDNAVCFPWSDDPSCPGTFEDIFSPDPFLVAALGPPPDARRLLTHGWEPLTIYSQLNESLKLNLSLEKFSRRFVAQLRGFTFKDDILSAVQGWPNSADGQVLGVHIRRTDRAAHHRDQFRGFLMGKQGLNGELPLYLSAMYGLLPAGIVRDYENGRLVAALRRTKKTCGKKYAVFSDDEAEAIIFEKTARRNGFHLVSQPAAAKAPPQREQGDRRLRKSTIKRTLVDLLCLSQCSAIAQSNRASTFSAVAAIIGAKPIVTPEPRYPFWRAIREATGRAPNDPSF